MASQVVVRRVPWHSWAEWERVHQLLYSSVSSADLMLGVQYVTAWLARGGVPPAVRATAQLQEWLLAAYVRVLLRLQSVCV
jgi:hypothetical protein